MRPQLSVTGQVRRCLTARQSAVAKFPRCGEGAATHLHFVRLGCHEGVTSAGGIRPVHGRTLSDTREASYQLKTFIAALPGTEANAGEGTSLDLKSAQCGFESRWGTALAPPMLFCPGRAESG
jgi:hypothetical protein